MRFDLWQSKRTYPLVDPTSDICTMIFSSQLCWKWTFLLFTLCVVAQKMLKAFVLTSLCIHTHQERGSQSSTWIYIIYPPIAFIQTSAWEAKKIDPFICHILWILVPALLLSSWNLNQNIVLRRFCTRRNYSFLYLFLLKHNLKCTKMTQNRYLKGTSLMKMRQSRSGALLINTVSTHYSAAYLNWGTWKKIVQSQKILKFFGKQTNKIQGSSKQPLTTLKQLTLLVLLPKNLRIFCFQKSLWLDNLLPKCRGSSSGTVKAAGVLFFVAATIQKMRLLVTSSSWLSRTSWLHVLSAPH